VSRLFLGIAVLGLAVLAGPGLADDGAAKKAAPGNANPTETKHTYLGLLVGAIPPERAGELSAVVPKGQGVLVVQVAKDSPAAKAHLQAEDILLSYGDQKLSSPDQLVKLVRGDKAGHEVSLTFVRDGKQETSKVVLGESTAPSLPQTPHAMPFPAEKFQEMFGEMEGKQDNSAWEAFDSMKLSRLDDKRWRAEIAYTAKDGKKENKTYEGTREEIQKDVIADKNLPANERAHLLRALNFHGPAFNFHFPKIEQIDPKLWQ
jgi:membrane-associated protease RseP (regulator of RpoE activity)